MSDELPKAPPGARALLMRPETFNQVVAEAQKDIAPDPNYFDVFTKGGVKFFRPRLQSDRSQIQAAAKNRRFGFWTDGTNLLVRRGIVQYEYLDPPIAEGDEQLPAARTIYQVIPKLGGVALAEEGTPVSLGSDGSIWLITSIGLCSASAVDRVEIKGRGETPTMEKNEQCFLIGRYTVAGTAGAYALDDVEYWLQSDQTVSYKCDGGVVAPSVNDSSDASIDSSKIDGGGDKPHSSSSPAAGECVRFIVSDWLNNMLCFPSQSADYDCKAETQILGFEIKVKIAAGSFNKCVGWRAFITCTSAKRVYATDTGTFPAGENTIVVDMDGANSEVTIRAYWVFTGPQIDAIACHKVIFEGKINNNGRNTDSLNPKTSKCCNSATGENSYASATTIGVVNYPENSGSVTRNMPGKCPARCGCSSSTPEGGG